MVELLPLLRDRRSIRAYDESHVLADDELAVLLEACLLYTSDAADE